MNTFSAFLGSSFTATQINRPKWLQQKVYRFKYNGLIHKMDELTVSISQVISAQISIFTG